MATVLPCDAAYGTRPCAEKSISKSKRIIFRDRRVAVRHAQRSSLELKQYLNNLCSPGGGPAWTPNREAPEFMPWIGFEVDAASCAFKLEEKYIIGSSEKGGSINKNVHQMHIYPEKVSSTITPMIGTRRTLRESWAAANLVTPPLPALENITVDRDPTLAQVELNSEDLGIPARRKILKEACRSEALPSTVSPLAESCFVTEEMCRGVGHASCDKCYVPDGRFGRHQACVRACANLKGSWGPGRCSNKCIHSSRFGYSAGELVGWESSDQDVPAGSQGKVSEFTEDAVAVKVIFGEYLFPPGVLYRIGQEVQGSRLGDSVAWTSDDYHASDVPRGSVGTLIGARGDKLIVDFSTRQLLLESADVRLADGVIKKKASVL